jgi:hypothetical protein
MENVYWSVCKVPVFLSDLNETLVSSIVFSKNTQILHFMKIRLTEAELFNADGRTHGQADGETDGRTEWRTDMPKLVVAVRKFAKAPSKEYVVSLCALHCLFQDRRGQ